MANLVKNILCFEFLKNKKKDLRNICSVCGKTTQSIITNIENAKKMGIKVFGNDILGYCVKCKKAYCVNHCHDDGRFGNCPNCRGELDWIKYK